ncbi:MAG: OmpA family protein [Candidatus Krumholzibacteria bacterium]|nr:OmpA family protein [Candidatus Krumholzibacteria bacterium]MDH4338543.1 OmpA family protein [Candidatus Krumholzibacteria bacterium]MDH5269246.1 OmpA family protein [Candidatus Krumholzibacteria bacterium]MDH5626967.1 OmpA family protein [Candidatus Krumholzibacteria bacterium]
MRSHSLAVVVPLVVLACAPSVDVEPILHDYDNYAADLRAVATDSYSIKLLETADAKRAQAETLIQNGKKQDAVAPMERAMADVRVAFEVESMQTAADRAQKCLLEVEQARASWQEAVFVLEQTEDFTGAKAPIAKRAPALEEEVPETLPATTLLPETFPPATMEAVSAQWSSWYKVAGERHVAAGDIEGRYRRSYNQTHAEKVDAPTTEQHRYLAARAVQELECRIRSDMNEQVCVDATQQMTAFSDARAQALEATLNLERSLQDDLKRDLEHLRAEAKTRQDELYGALSQLQGKFASIRRDARGTIVSLADILFDFNKATLKRDVEFNLVKIATILNQFGEMKIVIEGHTDSIGTEEYNLQLSQRRAQAVHDFLVSQDVAPDRLTAEGFGESRPVADNDTDEGRQKNRRVDLVIQDAPQAQ